MARKEYSGKKNKELAGFVSWQLHSGRRRIFFWCLLSVTRWSLFSEEKLAWAISSCLVRTDAECYVGNDKNVLLAKKVLQKAVKCYKLFLNMVIKHW